MNGASSGQVTTGQKAIYPQQAPVAFAASLKRKLMSNETNDYEAINQIVRRYPGDPELQAQLAEELGILDTYKVYLSR